MGHETGNKVTALIEELRALRTTASALRSSIEKKVQGVEQKLKELQDVRARVGG
jgi:predicted  nucleic acid-binding Zn-ribbon protein